ncbi:cytochrome P450 [Nesidiocoris tenuis]|uniref:Cytochrome P450 n=1 Tax=Nesidiocoris tenuis TaxID=355587 RepID=A0ABN7A9I3_9HEMI|nr:cytochrome P450 [Nesidiocoris tenuis]
MSRRLVRALSSKTDGPPFNIHNHIKLCALDVICDERQFYSDVILETGLKWGFTQNDMAVLSKDIYLAGTDATSTTMASCLAFLAMFPEHQKKVYDELFEIFGDSDRDPTLDDLKKMVYLEMCLKEALRHCAPAAITRRLSSDIQIENYHFPKGAMLYFAFYFTHKNPMWWKRPEDFYPDHFSKEAVAKRPKGVFMPFSAGPRGCPGQTFAWLSMKTITSRLIRSYEFHTNMEFEKSRYHVLLVPQIKEGYFVSITNRSNKAHK